MKETKACNVCKIATEHILHSFNTTCSSELVFVDFIDPVIIKLYKPIIPSNIIGLYVRFSKKQPNFGILPFDVQIPSYNNSKSAFMEIVADL